MPFRATPRIPSGIRFDLLFPEGREAVLTSTHRVESEPATDRPRWTVGAALRPDARAAQVIEQVAKAAAGIVGRDHWLAGAVSSSHLSLRRHLEPYRRPVVPGDPLVARYAAALRVAVEDLVYFTGPIRDPRHLVAWVAARRQMEITELQVTGIQIVHWDYTGTGMVPTVLAAADHIPSMEGRDYIQQEQRLCRSSA